VKAQYTPEALRRKITGTVLVQGVVGVDGSFRDGHIVKSLDTVYGLDEEALKCASQWRFEPGTRNGQPVPVSVSLEISFYLK
jgi:TonB family protein